MYKRTLFDIKASHIVSIPIIAVFEKKLYATRRINLIVAIAAYIIVENEKRRPKS